MNETSMASRLLAQDFLIVSVWGAVRKNIISDRFNTKAAISVHI